MALKEFHIGKLIQERLKYEEHSVSWRASTCNILHLHPFLLIPCISPFHPF